MSIVVTGVAGFIGSSTARALLARGEQVVGIDNLNNYYDPSLKQARLDALSLDFGDRFRFERIDFSDASPLEDLGRTSDFDRIVHLGAQAGVRYSLENPAAYFQSNLVGHGNLLELARQRRSSHFVYASSSSVRGAGRTWRCGFFSRPCTRASRCPYSTAARCGGTSPTSTISSAALSPALM